MTHLWEVDHPYYISESNYFNRDCHTLYESWDEFANQFSDSDLDYNWFVAWDWREGADWELGTYNGDDYYRHARFILQRIGRRKALLDSHEIKVCRADEPAILEFLRPRWEYMREMWEPIPNAPSEETA